MDKNVKNVMSKREMLIWAKNVMKSFELTRHGGKSSNINFICPYTEYSGLMTIAYSKKSGKTTIARISEKDYQKNGYDESILIAQAIAYSRLIGHKVPEVREEKYIPVVDIKAGMYLDNERKIVQVYHEESETVVITKNCFTGKLDTYTYENTNNIVLWE